MITGKYSGPVRGRDFTTQVDVISDAILIKGEGAEEVDTIRTYVGNNTWLDGNDVITIKDGILSVDQIYGYYIMEKTDL